MFQSDGSFFQILDVCMIIPRKSWPSLKRDCSDSLLLALRSSIRSFFYLLRRFELSIYSTRRSTVYLVKIVFLLTCHSGGVSADSIFVL